MGLSYSFDIDKDYKNIFKNLEKIINTINNELNILKNYKKDITVCGEICDPKSMFFNIEHDGEKVNVHIGLMNDNGYINPLTICKIDKNYKVDCDVEIFNSKNNKLIYTINIFIYKADEEIGGKLININTNIGYKEYLKSNIWNKTRRCKLEEANYKCQLCSKKDIELHVHHNTYENIGNEEMNDLIVLCKDCHSKFHDKI